MPVMLIASPKCAITMPHIGIGVRRKLRPHNGSHAATAKAAARDSPRIGNTPAEGEAMRSMMRTTAAAKIGARANEVTRFGSSRRQRSIGPTSNANMMSNAIGTVALLK